MTTLSSPPRPTDGNLQSVFDYVATKLFEQGVPCMTEDGAGCAYKRGSLHCAIGWLLPRYDPNFEGLNIEDLIESGVFGKVNRSMFFLLADLQHAHDTVAIDRLDKPCTPDTFRKELRSMLEEIAKRHKLNDSALTNH